MSTLDTAPFSTDNVTGFPEITVEELLADESSRPHRSMSRYLRRFFLFLAGAVPTITLIVWLYTVVADTFVGKLTSLFLDLLF